MAALIGMTALTLLTGNADVIPESLKKGETPGVRVHLARVVGHELAIVAIVMAASIVNGRCATLAKFLTCASLGNAAWHHAWGNRNEVLAGAVMAPILGYFGFVGSGEPATKWGKHAIACTLEA